jgi:hypothetical protein
MTGFRRFTAQALGRTSLLALLCAAVLLVPAAALSGSTEKAPSPGSAKAEHQPADPDKPAKAAKADNPAKPAKAAEPARAADKPVKPAKRAKAAKPAKSTVSRGKSGDAQHHVIICHRTGSATNPYVVINVSVRAWVHGHQTHPMRDHRADILLKDPATPGEKMPTAACTAAANSTNDVKNGFLVVDPTSSTVGLPATTLVNKPLVIVVHTTPNAAVAVEGARVSGVTSTTANERGVARLRITPRQAGVVGVLVQQSRVKSIGVLGVQASGAQLTG